MQKIDLETAELIDKLTGGLYRKSIELSNELMEEYTNRTEKAETLLGEAIDILITINVYYRHLLPERYQVQVQKIIDQYYD